MVLLLLLLGCGDDRPAYCLADEPGEAAAVATPNVLMVVLDDIGLDLTSAYDVHPEAAATPTLEALAASGVRFDRAYANPTCSPTRASLFTGRHPSRHGIGTWIAPNASGHSLPVEEHTVAEIAVETGRATALIGKWHLSVNHDDQAELDPGRHGFQRFQGVFGNPRMYVGEQPDGELGYERWQQIHDGEVTIEEGYLTTRQVDDTLDAIQELPEPWFIVLSLNAAHSPLHRPPEKLWDGEQPVTEGDFMRVMVRATDAELGRLFDAIPVDILDRTDVYTVGDNGSAGAVVMPPFDPDGSKGTVDEGGIRVPMMVCGPSVANPGRTSDQLTHVVDVFSTLVAAFGGANDAVVDGVDLTPVLRDDGEADRDAVFVEQFAVNGINTRLTTDRTLVTDRWKLRVVEGRSSLFDLAADPWGLGVDHVVTPTAESAAVLPDLELRLRARTREVNER